MTLRRSARNASILSVDAIRLRYRDPVATGSLRTGGGMTRTQRRSLLLNLSSLDRSHRQSGAVPDRGRSGNSVDWRSDRKLAILMAMSVTEQMSLADVKNRLSEVVDRLEREHGRVVITKHGHPAAVVMSVDDLESLEETLDIMDNAALLGDIRESLTELADIQAAVLSKDEVLRLISGQ
jgi:antitoxin YefM